MEHNNPTFPYLPVDIPLPLPIGDFGFILIPVFHILLVLAFLVHIVFINVLLGSSLLSVINNWIGHLKQDKNYDRAAYLLTTPITISENMGALWGVAPLLIVSVMYTVFFYTASIGNSPQWLHIIWGNMVAFLLSYLYKFTWEKLQNNKATHITIGLIGTLIFFSLPPVFMTTVQRYLTPSTWHLGTTFWDYLFRSDTLFRLAHFYLGTLAVNGMFMLIYGAYKRDKNQDVEAAYILIRQGKAWFLIPTVLNLLVGLLTFFQFPNYGIESFYSKGFVVFIIIAVISISYPVVLLIKEYLNDNISMRNVVVSTTFLAITLIAMGITRHGMRISLLEPAMAEVNVKTSNFIANVEKEYKNYQQLASTKTTEEKDKLEGEKLIEKNGCVACHSIDKKIVGPPFKEIAKRNYTPERIIELVYNPEPQNWPGYPKMTPMTHISKEEIKKIAEWINSLNK